jgi:phosphoglycolate phosphatase-like HAD superfamily hydrolase
VARVLAVDLDSVLGDTTPLWDSWLEDLARRSRIDLDGLPQSRADAVEELDRRVGNWPPLLERFAENHAPVYLRPHAEVSAALRRVRDAGAQVVAFTDAPEPLAKVALAHLAARLVDRVVAEPPAGSVVVRSREQLFVQSEAWTARK